MELAVCVAAGTVHQNERATPACPGPWSALGDDDERGDGVLSTEPLFYLSYSLHLSSSLSL